MFASKSVPEHLLRGLIGAAAIGAAMYGEQFSVAAWALAPVAFVAWKGCPTCWAVGLYQTIHNALAAEKLERECVEGKCELKLQRS